MRKSILRSAVVPILVLMVAGTAAGWDARSELERTMRRELHGKIFVFRHYIRGERLTFAPDGNPVYPVEPGTWVADSALMLANLSLSQDKLRLEGDRVISFYDSAGALQQLVHQGRHIKLELLLGPGGATEANVNRILSSVFLNRDESAASRPAAPPSISPSSSQSGKPVQLTRGETLYAVGKGVSPPKPVNTPDPVYPPEERRKGHQGKTKLRIILDSKGQVHSIGVDVPKVTDFELRAIEAVSRWRFEPARLDGQPVAVLINVEVNYRLY